MVLTLYVSKQQTDVWWTKEWMTMISRLRAWENECVTCCGNSLVNVQHRDQTIFLLSMFCTLINMPRVVL